MNFIKLRIFRSALSLIGLLSFALPTSSFASSGFLPSASILISQNKPSLLENEPFAEQRPIYQQADLALKSRQYTKFNRLNKQLSGYPLQSYLEYKNLNRKLGDLKKQQIEQFLASNKNTLIAEKFRRNLIKYYAKQSRWSDLLEIYQAQNSVSLQCLQLHALIETGQQKQAFTRIEPLWLSGSSQPKACDPVFDSWQKAGHLTDKLRWQRIELAINKGRSQLARYLAKTLNKNDRQWVDMWLNIRKRPEKAATLTLLKQDHVFAQNIRSYSVKRLARKNPEQAIALWQQFNKAYHFSSFHSQSIYRSIGLSMARSHHPDASNWLNKVDKQQHDKYSREWLIRTAIRNADWAQTVQSIEQLPHTDQADLRWQFWWAYAQQQQGNSLDARGIFQYLASQRSYYGFLAADRLGLPYAFNDRPIEFSQMELNGINHRPAALRASEFYKLDNILDARREWYHLTQSLNTRQKLAASKLAQQWQWHDRAIYTMGKTPYRDDIQLRFPLPMKNAVETWSDKQSIDMAWTYAIMRRESAFMPDARSHMGALGLMQIQPGTARQVARKMRVKYRGKRSLLRADTNIKLGTGYLSQMLKKLNSQQVLATAAYNAGPHRVKTWLPETEPMAAIRWIETIPFAETREYVNNVLAYTAIYQYLLNDRYTRLSYKMPQIPARRPANELAELQTINATEQ